MIARLFCLGLLGLCLSAAGAVAAAVAPRASLPDIESQVMCVTCGVPLSIAESPQANEERGFIRSRIALGETTAQIKQDLVAQLGPGVLALPSQSGFNLAVYIVPVALIVVLGGILAVALPRWRRRGTDPDGDGRATELSAADAARLDADLERFPG
jgi:cytochrome c-type biogenesis protein CcmH/NrfF